MFFRRERPKNPAFAERLENLRNAGFSVTPQAARPGAATPGTARPGAAAAGAGTAVRVSRGNVAIDLTEERGTVHREEPAGILMGDEIGALVDGGYQKFFQTPSGRKKPALASELKALHDFEEDLKEALGEVSL